MGDVPGALSAYSRATEAGEEPRDLRAVLRYAEQLETRGERAAAEPAFKRATESGEPDVGAAAWRGVASRLIERGELNQGLAALEAIIAIGDPNETPRALRNLGTLKEDALGDMEGARLAYEAAIAHDHPLHSPGARVNLAQLLEKQGDVASASLLFREVIDSGHPVESGRARTLLGYLLDDQGDETQALSCFEAEMAANEDDEWGQRAALGAGGIYLRRGELDRAAKAFLIASRIEEPDTAATAAFLCGEAERQRGNDHAALDAYVKAVSSPRSAGARFAAAKQAGVILFSREDHAGARDLFSLAEQTEDPEERARGACLLGLSERALGNRGPAIAAFERAMSTPGAPPDIREMAQQSLLELR
jgi:tetratricopeptide (TPR) repeat protein